MDTIAAIYTHVVEEGHASEEDFNRLRTLAHTLIERERLDGIVLAGTDLAFVFNPGNADFSHIDGARVPHRCDPAENRALAPASG